jgi:REP element-mobilizing transposase RayT
MNIRNEILEPDCFYHIYNRGINGCVIFDTDENYLFFLQKFAKYLDELCDIYCYCLMPNHFHFLIKVKSIAEIEEFANNTLKNISKSNAGLHSTTNIVSKQIGKLISSYSQSYNKVKKRHGNLLESPFKRIKITSEEYLKNLILYIHSNPLDLGIGIGNYKYSSYQAIISKSKTKIKRNKVLEIFDNLDNFIYCHISLSNQVKPMSTFKTLTLVIEFPFEVLLNNIGE